MNQGYILLHRKLLDNPICGNVNGLRIWLECLFAATWQDIKIDYAGQETTLPRGCFVFGRLAWGKRLKMSDRTVDNWVKKMLQRGMISVLVSGQGKPTIYKIDKYEEYQSIGQVSGQVSTQVSDRLVRTNNKDNKNNKKKITTVSEETKAEAEAIEAYFNSVNGTRYHNTSPWLLRFEHWRTIYSLEEIKMAITQVKNDAYWKGQMNLDLLFRLRNPKGEAVDQIGRFYNEAIKGIPKHILDQRRMTQ